MERGHRGWLAVSGTIFSSLSSNTCFCCTGSWTRLGYILINAKRSDEDLPGSWTSKPAFSCADSADRCGSALICPRLGDSNKRTAGSSVALSGGDFAPFDGGVFCAGVWLDFDTARCGAATSVGEETTLEVASPPPPHPASKRLNSSAAGKCQGPASSSTSSCMIKTR